MIPSGETGIFPDGINYFQCLPGKYRDFPDDKLNGDTLQCRHLIFMRY